MSVKKLERGQLDGMSMCLWAGFELRRATGAPPPPYTKTPHDRTSMRVLFNYLPAGPL